MGEGEAAAAEFERIKVAVVAESQRLLVVYPGMAVLRVAEASGSASS